MEVTKLVMTKQTGFAGRGFCTWVCVSSESLALMADEIGQSDILERTLKLKHHRQHVEYFKKYVKARKPGKQDPYSCFLSLRNPDV